MLKVLHIFEGFDAMKDTGGAYHLFRERWLVPKGLMLECTRDSSQESRPCVPSLAAESLSFNGFVLFLRGWVEGIVQYVYCLPLTAFRPIPLQALQRDGAHGAVRGAQVGPLGTLRLRVPKVHHE